MSVLQQWQTAQASPEVVVNENFAALSHVAVYGKDATTTAGLTWGYLGGRWSGVAVAAGVVALTANAINYLVVDRSTGVLSASAEATNWDNSGAYARVYKLTTGVATVTAAEDWRAGAGGVQGAGGGAGGNILVFDEMPADPPMYTLFLVKSGSDTVAPVVTEFAATSGVASPVPITAFAATDAVGVTGYWVGESNTVPSLSDPGWSSTPQTSYSTTSTGAVTLYARARDAAGNTSDAATQAVTIPAGSAPDPVEVEWPYNSSVHTSLFSVQANDPNTSVAMVYRPSDSRKLSSVQVPMRREIDGPYPGVGDITLEVRSGSATGSLLGSTTTAPFADGTVSTRTFTFADPITLVPEVDYFLVFKLTSPSGGQALYRILTRAGTGVIWSNPSGSWTSYSAQSPMRLEFSA